MPLARNGHSFRECDPLAAPKDARDDADAACDVALVEIRYTSCAMIFPKPRLTSPTQIARISPFSETQIPRNYSLVRANREYFKALGFQLGALMTTPTYK